MPIGDIIGGAKSVGSEQSGDGAPISQAADSAGETIRFYLNEYTPGDIEWRLNFAFIVTVLSAASSALSLYGAL